MHTIVSFYLKFVLVKVEDLTPVRKFLLRKSVYPVGKVFLYFTQAVEEAVLCSELQILTSH
jgi:hypothetical protein